MNPVAAAPEDKDRKEFLQEVDQLPVPKGGITAFSSYLQSALILPEEAWEDKAGGKVMVEFIVNTDSTLSELKVVKGLGPAFDQAAINALTNATGWTPAVKDGTNVPVKMILPITFQR